MQDREEHLVHARIDEEETRVAAGPHGGRGQAAVAVALLEEAQEGGADLPRRRAGGTVAAGAAAPAPWHLQQRPPPQPGGRSHGAARRMAAPGRPEGAVRGGGGTDTTERGGTAGKRRAVVPAVLRRTRGLQSQLGLGRAPARPGPSRPLRAPPRRRDRSRRSRRAGAMAVRGVPCLAWCLRRVGASGDWLLLEAGTQVSRTGLRPLGVGGRAGTALGAQFGGVSWFLTALPRRKKHRLVPLKEQPPFVAVRSGRRGGRHSAPVTPQGVEDGARRWSGLGQAFACLYLYILMSYLDRVIRVTVT